MEITYDQLLASCQNYCIDDSTQFVTQFPLMVQLSEMRIIKDLNLDFFDGEATGTLTLGSQSLTKPDDLITIQDLFIFIDGTRTYLQERTKGWCDDYWPIPNSQDVPVYYADDSTDSWIIVPTPDASYPYQVNYIKRPSPMAENNQTTYIGSKFGEGLLYATLVGSMMFFREDVVSEQGVTKAWEGFYSDAIDKAMRELNPNLIGKDDETSKATREVR